MDNFKNFGEALAWMMESPENVAVSRLDGESWPTKWENDTILWRNSDGEWHTSSAWLNEFAKMSWSRAPKEPQVFTFEGKVNYAMPSCLSIDDDSFVPLFNKTIGGLPNGTPVKITLEVG